MNSLTLKTKHDIVSGNHVNNCLYDEKQIGHALNPEGTNYYLVKLWLFPREAYFLSKNRSDDTKYTVFAKRVEDDENNVIFQNPVGYGVVRSDLTTHLEITFPLLRLRMYMSLFPSLS